MAVTLTEAAARHIDRYIARRGKGIGLRLGVKTSGWIKKKKSLEDVYLGVFLVAN